jgi:hypothetical protein
MEEPPQDQDELALRALHQADLTGHADRLGAGLGVAHHHRADQDQQREEHLRPPPHAEEEE